MTAAATRVATPATPLARRNPTVKLAVLVVVSFAMLFLWDVPTLAVLYLGTVTAVLASRALSPRLLAGGHVPFLAFAVGLIAVNAMSRPGEVLVDGPVRITVEGLAAGVALALRALVVGVCSLAFIATTPPRDLMVSLMAHAKLSPRYAYPLLAGHRLLAGLPAQWSSIRAAHAVRATRTRTGRRRFGPAAFGRCAFALLVGMVRSSERIALALESRGLGSGPRTLWRPVGLGREDAWFAVAVLGTAAAIIGLGGVLNPLA